MSKEFNLQKAVLNSTKKGVRFIEIAQQKDGSFLTLSSPNPQTFENSLTFHSTFSTCFILLCLNSLAETLQIRKIKQKAVSYLISQKSDFWSFNYWARDSEESKKYPYPDDLDDTFCALTALYQYNPKIIDGTALARIVTLLTAAESQEGGPYRTWLVSKNSKDVWKDIDIAVNSNIAYFLHLHNIHLPNLNRYIEDAIKNDKLYSPYYPSFYPIIYFISRFYSGKYKKILINKLFEKQHQGCFGDNVLDTAFAVLSLINFKYTYAKYKPAISYILSAQKSDGSWQASPFYIDPSHKAVYYGGASALTTAFCIQALYGFHLTTKYNNMLKTQKQPSKANNLHNKIIYLAKKRFSLLNNDLKNQSIKALYKTIKNDKTKQITLLPYFFAQALKADEIQIPKDILLKLGLANLYGWIAYTIYDDFLDEEGDPKFLSVANIALRELTAIFETILAQKTGFNKFFHKTMDTIDNANMWEVTHCRVQVKNGLFNLSNTEIPNWEKYEKLSERSLGHALGPLALLFLLGYTEQSKEVASLLQFFHHYLIAKQLNDDAHDWEKDLKKGHINPVAAKLIEKYQKQNTNDNLILTYSTLIIHLQRLFWYKVIVNVCKDIKKHCTLARKVLKQIPAVKNTQPLENILIPLEQSAKKALDEQRETIKFLETYDDKSEFLT